VIWNKLLATRVTQRTSLDDLISHSFTARVFPDLSGIREHRPSVTYSNWAHSLSLSVDDVLASFAINGPLIPRLILAGALSSPVVAISLQRDAVNIGGNQGMLSIGELPAGITAEDLTWVSLRGYTVAEGGLPPPKDSPNEVQLNASSYATHTENRIGLPHHLGGCRRRCVFRRAKVATFGPCWIKHYSDCPA
jgi:hypothetical protein